MDLVNDPIPVLIRKLAIPAAVGFLFNTMYNVVDTFYAGKISEDALEAMGYSFPVFFIILALASGVGQGSTALIANLLGSKDQPGARLMSQQSLVFGAVVGLGVAVVGWLVSPFLYRLLKADGVALELSIEYMNIILIGAPMMVMQGVINASLQAGGDTKSYRNFLIAGSILNLFLDPWFLYGGFGVPSMGIRGIALATTIIQFLGVIYLVTRLREIEWRRGGNPAEFVPLGGHWRQILNQGFPASLNMITVALGIFIITWFLSDFSKASVSAYIAATRIEQVILVPTIGFNIAMLTLAGQNNGAGRIDRVREAWDISSRYGLVVMLVGGVILFLFRGTFMGLFTSDADIIAHGRRYLGIASMTLFAYVILFQTVFMLQGLKRPAYALWIGLYRQIVAPILTFWFLGRVLGWQELGVWWGVFVVTWSAALFTRWYGMRVLNQLARKQNPPH
ncbi:MAG: MATE family efflux transporter [Verrucomicrobia bacterium]|nr:MATE family efflux transporter [Verrucomicrobiota bacterium]